MSTPLLALAAALAASTPATPTPTPTPTPQSPASLVVVGEWRGYRVVGAPCTSGQVCMDVDVDAVLRRVRTISGPRVRSTFTARLHLEAPPAAGYRPVLLVWPGAAGSPWQARWVTIAPSAAGGRTPICVDLATLRDAHVAAPARSRLYGDRACFSV